MATDCATGEAERRSQVLSRLVELTAPFQTPTLELTRGRSWTATSVFRQCSRPTRDIPAGRLCIVVVRYTVVLSISRSLIEEILEPRTIGADACLRQVSDVPRRVGGRAPKRNDK